MRTMMDMFLEQAGKRSEHIAVMDHHGAYTYGQLNRRSAILAKHLLDMKRGDEESGRRIAVLLPRSRDFFIAVLGILRAGFAVVPMDSEYPSERIRAILKDAGCFLCISAGGLSSKAADISVLGLDEALQDEAREEADESLNLSAADAEGLILFTSGTTGKPKGVVHRQSIFSNGPDVLKEYHQFAESDVTCCMAGLTFIISTVDLYSPLMVGGSVYLADETERKNVKLLHQIIEKHGVTGMYLPPQMFQVMRELYGPLPLAYVLLSGEKAQSKYAGDGNLLEFYGSTEAAGVLAHRIAGEDHRILGKPCGSAKVYLLAENGERITTPGAVGEFCVASPYIAIGYNNLPEETAAKFTDNPFHPAEAPLYHSGDYMAYDEEGSLIFHGRKDRMVKVRGYRVELGEIEAVMGKAEGVAEAACVAVHLPGGDQICCYYTGEKSLDASSLHAYGKRILPDYMVPDYFIHMEALPRNERNKVDYLALQALDLSVTRKNVLPETERERGFWEIAARILGTDKFGVTDDLVCLGLSSIGAMRLGGEIHRAFGLQIPVAEILRMPTVRSLAAWTEEILSGASNRLSTYPKRELYPITENQRGILIDWERNRGATQYNLPAVTLFDGVKGEALVSAVKAALDAHGYLKTRFVHRDGDVMQERRDEDEPAVSLRELAMEPDRDFFRNRILPFNLFSERLYRMEVYTCGDRAWLFADIHHAVYDGLSVRVFMEEIHRALAGESLSGERVTAYDFALYEKELQSGETYAEAQSYFHELTEGAIPAVFADSKRPDGKPTGLFTMSVPAEEINRFCQDLGVTPGSFFQAALGEVLRRLTREEKPFYLTVESGRSLSPALMGSVGMFVQTLPVVALAAGDMTSGEYVRAVHRQLRETYAREFYPYTKLVESRGLHGEIMFVYQGEVLEEESAGENGSFHMEAELNAAQFPLSLELLPGKTDYVLHMEYDGMRYGSADVEAFADMVKNAALGLVKESHVKNISLVSPEEEKELLHLSAGEKLAYNQGETWLDLFQSHVKNTPEKTAVVDSRGAFTYGDLDRASDSIANYLLKNGVAAGDFVALKMGRVKEFLAAVIAVHKVGAGYVPIDPEYPEERINYMLEDSEAHVVLTEEKVAEALAKYSAAASLNRAVPEGRAYMIYTSGSTGKPKGVVIRHKAMTSFVHFIRERWHLTEKSRIACHSTFSFDASVEDLYPALTAGGCVFIVPEEARRDIFEMKAFLKKHAINGGCYSTQFGQLLASENEPLDLDYIVVGGEAMTRTLNVRGPVYNTYGPTEFTVDATYFELEKGKDYASIPIGRPVSNAWAFVCDTYGHLLPQGMTGELCLAGSQLAEGYWKQPELTAKSFVDCSFLPGQKMYRAGDLARYNEEGQLEYLGRIDTQVKLRGFRIEMGEIETRAGQFAGIESVAAEVRREQLVLYYTSAEGSEIDAEELRHFLAETLADYMVPTVYVPLSAMPMTPSGKIDRKALPEPEWKGTEYVAPANETESALAGAFGEILGIKDKLGAFDDFFLLGGDSIKAIRLVSLLREKGIRVSVSDIMSQKTVRRIASRVEQSKETAPSQEPYEGQVPDTAIVSFFKDLALPEPWHYNQCLLLAMRERGVLPALQKAMDALAFQHDLLRAVWRAQASHHAPAPALAHPARRRAGANVASRSCASVGAKQSHHAPVPALAHPARRRNISLSGILGQPLPLRNTRQLRKKRLLKYAMISSLISKWRRLWFVSP